ncbi:MAG TPA: putative molybdenum carrier protein [Candidatus Rifleibacterium sp.]|nr:putative molybdenum carrier protein [Candidatus Rifleibacterium sp.]HPT45602.1 putative molybdenum carrier protein [Candidatus Rifleibacterium sp.]
MLISGGQTGVDRAALDFALTTGIAVGGWCPAGRRAEDGVIPGIYKLREADSPLYQQRTRLNVCDSDATLIFVGAGASRGTALTIELCRQKRKPYLVVAMTGDRTLVPNATPACEPSANTQSDLQPEPFSATATLRWLSRYRPGILNVAGPRAGECPGADVIVTSILRQLFLPADGVAPVWPPQRPFTPDLPSF